MKPGIAKKFFAYLAKHYPVMCASGAFPLMPPVTDASKRLDRLDDLSRKGIARHLASLESFRRTFLAEADKATVPTDKALAEALAMNASGAIAELDGIRAWERAPELYLQVAFTGLEQAADLPAKNERARQKRFIARLKAVPALLAHAIKNVEAASAAGRANSQTMVRDCARYLTELSGMELGRTGRAPRFLADALASLREYDRFVTSRPVIPDPDGPPFSYTAEHVLGTSRSAEELRDLAEAEFDARLTSLKRLESEIGGGSWQELYEGYEGPPTDGLAPLDLIIREIHRLRSFVQNGPLSGVFTDSGLRIEPQPRHMASGLRPIHHDPVLGAWENEPSRCYVSPQIFTGNRFRDTPAHLARIRREFPFLTAMQTYPGRHLLDSQRRALDDPILSQVTNPLFMAGWLAFSEHLLDELGYLETDLDRLVRHVRGLRRAALARIDCELASGDLDQDHCLTILDKAGFTREEGLAEAKLIRTAPGHRIMPILGLHELTELRREWRLDLPLFCKTLFAEGQLPLPCIARRQIR
ncbi:DUF885 family protein [Pseudodesulfovibrio thermohalotolerans]|uniref:DUF885 family protein n=1 Tax=Pseudodesulfovibrio thermohalotolerans TaxID=2880651 RepID=UPI002442CF8D|nr:DUF885 family protein [Pseudodesulfovibrio thermohalotolerans]WFS63216.1 DUF885 family protein [Pseudodesulfovibrio thermohalotolerans]